MSPCPSRPRPRTARRRDAREAGNSSPARAEGMEGAADAARGLRRDVVRFLRIRERTRREVADYLARRGHPRDAIGPVLDELVATGLVDDRRFAEIFLRDRSRLRPIGREAAGRELRARGVGETVVEEAFARLEPPWDDARLAQEALARRWPRWPAEKRRERAVRWLRARGFGGGAIRSALERMTGAQR